MPKPRSYLDSQIKASPASQQGISHPELTHFKKYCASCHVGQMDPKLNFMDATDDEKLLLQIRNNPEIQRRLDWEKIPEAQRMPPARSRVGKLLRVENAIDRLEMLQTLQRSAPCIIETLKRNPNL
jgi:hypothetical protein